MTFPTGWAEVPIVDVLEPLDDGRLIHQGMSPQCFKDPSPDHETWGVLKTTAIQDGRFLDVFNKELPEKVRPKPHLEVRPDDILLTCAGPRPRCGVVARVHSVRPRLLISGKMYRFRPLREAVDTAFLEAALRTRECRDAIDKMKTGGSESGLNLTQDRFEKLKVRIAPLAEQRRIVAKLETLGARARSAREELDRVSMLAENVRQRVVTSAFRGELTAKWRVENPDEATLSTDQTAAAYAGVAGVERRRAPVAIDWQPEIRLPCTWRWASIDELVGAVQYGTSAKTSHDEGVPVLRMGNIQHGELDWTNLKYLPADHSEFPDLLLADGDVLFNRTNSAELVGKSTVFRGQPGPVSFASYLIRVRCSAVLPDLLARYINCPFGRAWASRSASQQVGQANINGTKLKALGIPLPPPGEQQEMLRLIRLAFARVDRLEAEVRHGRALLDRLEVAVLTKAFRGELVPQDPNEEPACVLLERIRGQHGAAPRAKRRRQSKELVNA